MSSNHKYDALRKHHVIKSLKIRLLKEPNKPASIETHLLYGTTYPFAHFKNRKNRNLKP